MNELDRIVDQMDRAYRENAWHGPSVLESLTGVRAGQAAHRPIAAAHTIWELVGHMAYWKDIVRRRLAGERPEYEEPRNFPEPRDRGPEAWRRTLADLDAAHLALVEEVRRVDESRLDEPPPGASSSRYVQIHGIIQHDLWHAGQIMVLRKSPVRSAKTEAKPASRSTATARPATKKPARRKPKKKEKAGRRKAKARG